MLNIKELLETYTLSEVLEMLDLTEEDVLQILIDTGTITWERLTDAIPMPVS